MIRPCHPPRGTGTRPLRRTVMNQGPTGPGANPLVPPPGERQTKSALVLLDRFDDHDLATARRPIAAGDAREEKQAADERRQRRALADKEEDPEGSEHRLEQAEKARLRSTDVL